MSTARVAASATVKPMGCFLRGIPGLLGLPSFSTLTWLRVYACQSQPDTMLAPHRGLKPQPAMLGTLTVYMAEQQCKLPVSYP